MPNSNKLTKIALLSASFILVAGFIVFGLEKANVINLYNKPFVTTADSTPKPVNTVSYTPATSSDQDEASKLKEDLMERSNNPQASPTKIDISLSAANQDVSGGPLIVRSLVNVPTGECKLVLTKDGVKKEYSATIENTGTYNRCKGFDVPVSDLSTGKWQLKLTASSGQAYGEVSQEVEVLK